MNPLAVQEHHASHKSLNLKCRIKLISKHQTHSTELVIFFLSDGSRFYNSLCLSVKKHQNCCHVSFRSKTEVLIKSVLQTYFNKLWTEDDNKDKDGDKKR